MEYSRYSIFIIEGIEEIIKYKGKKGEFTWEEGICVQESLEIAK